MNKINMKESGSTRYQYLGALCCNLLSVAFGGCFGWSSVNFIVLQSNETPLTHGPLTLGEASWVVALLMFGCFWGNLLFGYVSEHFGRKWPLFWMAVPQIVGWLMILKASHIYHLYVARFLLGIASGSYFVLIPLFVTEISDDKIRGTLNSLIELACNVGILLELIASSYLSYEVQAWMFIAISLVFMMTFVFFPETPDYLERSQKKMEAVKSFNFYRNLNKVHPEIPRNEMDNKLSVISKDKDAMKDNLKADKLKFKDFCTPVAQKALIIGVGLMVLNQFSGGIVMLSYMASIFNESGSTLTADQSSIVVGAIQCVGAYGSTLLIDRIGRKLLLTISAVGNALGLICLGGFGIFKQMEFDVEEFKWVPLISFSFSIFISSMGLMAAHFCVIVEILPEKIKNYGYSFCLSLMWIFEFSINGLYPIVSLSIGLNATMFIFAVISFGGALFVMLYIPETKGKSHEEIMKSLEKKK